MPAIAVPQAATDRFAVARALEPTAACRVLVAGCARGRGLRLAYALAATGFDIRVADDCAQLLDAVARTRPHALLLARGPDRVDAFDALRALRRVDALPVVVVAAPYTEFDHALALELGADDYLPEAASERVVAARLRALARGTGRSRGQHDGAVIASGALPPACATLSVDRDALVARYGDRALRLSAMQFTALAYLIERAPAVVTRAALLRALGRPARERAVDVLVSRLRRQLRAQGVADVAVHAVRPHGYQLLPATP